VAKYIRILSLCLCIALVGCEKKEAIQESTGPEPPPPPTAQEIAQSVITELQLDMPTPMAGARFPMAIRSEMVDGLGRKKSLHSADPVGKEALEHVKVRVEQRVRDFTNAEAWQHVLVFIDLHAVLDPDSKKYGSLREDAVIQLQKPRITLQGMSTINGQRFINLKFYIPATDETHKERLSIGDELHGLKLVSVFGKNRGITMEYLQTGERFVAFFPGQR
jgi:hypothetical protein